MVKKWTEEEIQILKSNYKNGIKSFEQYLPNRTYNSIRTKARELNIKANRSISNRRLNYNKDFFKIPNLINSYWAGLLAADGCIRENINCIKLGLKKEDGYILEQFSKDLCYTGEIRTYIKDTNFKKAYIESVLTLYDAKDNINYLNNNFNITYKKALTLKPPSLSFENNLAFMIGLLDGDGWISIINNNILTIGFSGTKEVLEWVREICDFISPSKRKISGKVLKTKSTHQYCVSNNRALILGESLLNINVPIKLERKWNKIKEYKELKGIIEE